jgi:hypothetical protein
LHHVRHLVLVLLLLAVAPATASAACGDTIIQDYLDEGVVDGKYSQACYDQALDGLDDDLREYTNAETDIAAAKLRQKKLDEQAAKPKPKPEPPVTQPAEEPEEQPERSLNEEPEAPPPSSEDDGETTQEAVATPPSDDGGEPPAPPAEEEVEPAGAVDEQPPPDTGEVLGTIAEVPPLEEVSDVRTTDGPLQQALRSVDSSSGNELPLPVIVLGGLAILLMSVGTGGLVLRRMSR